MLNSSNTSVTWQVNGITAGNSTVGTISSTGTYKAPSKIPSQTVATVTESRAADVTKSASAPVSLNPVVITIDPTSAILSAGGQQPFTATVQNASSNSVTWPGEWSQRGELNRRNSFKLGIYTVRPQPSLLESRSR